MDLTLQAPAGPSTRRRGEQKNGDESRRGDQRGDRPSRDPSLAARTRRFLGCWAAPLSTPIPSPPLPHPPTSFPCFTSHFPRVATSARPRASRGFLVQRPGTRPPLTAGAVQRARGTKRPDTLSLPSDKA